MVHVCHSEIGDDSTVLSGTQPVHVAQAGRDDVLVHCEHVLGGQINERVLIERRTHGVPAGPDRPVLDGRAQRHGDPPAVTTPQHFGQRDVAHRL